MPEETRTTQVEIIVFKGGLISVGVGIILTFILMPFGYYADDFFSFYYWELPASIVAVPMILILQKIIFFQPLSFFTKWYIVYPSGIIDLFLIGMLVTYIGKKIKRRKIS